MGNSDKQKERFGTIEDYVRWRGDLRFAADPWNDTDALIAAMITYANFGENELIFGGSQLLMLAELAGSDLLDRIPQAGLSSRSIRQRCDFIVDMARSTRYRDIRILEQVNDVDPKRNIQFSALTLEVPGVGIVIGFRGTDTSVVGWKEDFMMSYTSPVPGQSAAAAYLKKIAGLTSGPLYVTGHSKGGNLSVYAAAHTEDAVRERIRGIYSFDGPGLDDETIASPAYREIAPLVHSVIPSDSIIGRLMNFHPVYRVVLSTARSFSQHDPFTWKLMGKNFLQEEDISLKAQIMDHSVHEWLKTCTAEQREAFVGAIFSLFDRDRKKKAEPLTQTMPEGTRRMVLSLLYRFISIQAGNTWSARAYQPFVESVEEMRERLKADRCVRPKSAVIEIDNQGNGYQAAAEEARNMAECNGLSRKNSLRLQLFAEEMLSMAHTVTGDMKAVFWIECSGERYDLHMSTRAVLDKSRRELLISASSSRKNDAARSFIGKLRDAFERAMTGRRDAVVYELPKDASAGGPRRDLTSERSHYERSVLLRLADDVRIAIRGGEVSMTVSKAFPETDGNT